MLLLVNQRASAAVQDGIDATEMSFPVEGASRREFVVRGRCDFFCVYFLT
jgi:hypothetical protein